MHAVKPLIIAALTATASATYFNGEALRREVLEVRETLTTTCETTSTATISSGSIMPYPTATVSTNSSGVCSSVLAGLSTVISGLPIATGALQRYLATAASTLTDPCSFSVPSSIATAFSIYESSVISFYSVHSSQFNSALQACPSLSSFLANPTCSTSTGSGSIVTATATGTTTQASTTATATKTTTPSSSSGSGSGSGSGSSSSSSSAAPSPASTSGANERDTNMVALLAAGLFGAVVAAL